MTLRPFAVSVPDDVLTDLHARLDRFRPLSDSPRRPRAEMNAALLARLVADWRRFDWHQREATLNAWPHFLADVDGTTVHLVHRRAADPRAPAILVMHGWPHTFQMQLRFAELLPDFHVVVPSLPGFAFSPAYADRAFSSQAVAETMHRLMTETLGYDAYLTYGEDVSAEINDRLASHHPDAVRGITATHAHFPRGDERARLTDPIERAFFERVDQERGAHGAYAHVQATRPDTLAAALNDSPAGLLAWLVEKLREWSDRAEATPADAYAPFSRDAVLTEAMIYWATQSIATSFRPYNEHGDDGVTLPVTVPAQVIVQRHEGDYPESLARRFYLDLRSFDRLDVGGHFTVAEVPEAMAVRVRSFARAIGCPVADAP